MIFFFLFEQSLKEKVVDIAAGLRHALAATGKCYHCFVTSVTNEECYTVWTVNVLEASSWKSLVRSCSPRTESLGARCSCDGWKTHAILVSCSEEKYKRRLFLEELFLVNQNIIVY